jgi:CheY-like chemotaxis protein
MPTEQLPATVLIIEDQAANWIARKAALEKAGFRVVATKSYNGASPGIDLLITSPDSVGLQLAVEAQKQGFPIIVLAAYAYPIGIHDKVAILLEPVSDGELVSTARTLLLAGKPG